INLISCGPLAHVSDIKLIRTDTTLDLSQKAEKGMPTNVLCCSFYTHLLSPPFLKWSMWDCGHSLLKYFCRIHSHLITRNRT
ncbi:unnamed protein product, partial [Prunus brigantina]